MNDSIESIWTKGFLNNDDLVAPKVNNLYEKKSIHIIDKFNRMFRINLIAIVVGSIFILVVTFFIGIPITGIAVFFLLNWLVVNGNKHLKTLEKIDKSQTSYHYLKTFDNWMKNQIASYTRLYTYFYPLFFLSFVVGMAFSSDGEIMIAYLVESFPDSSLFLGIPLFVIAIITVITAVIAYFSPALYRMDLDLVYGNILRKLDEIISDMEELRA